jgi:hypothetical protein
VQATRWRVAIAEEVCRCVEKVDVVVPLRSLLLLKINLQRKKGIRAIAKHRLTGVNWGKALPDLNPNGLAADRITCNLIANLVFTQHLHELRRTIISIHLPDVHRSSNLVQHID